jgi:protein-L-isoaspartate(D-aspartate) O-methyltransferase
MTSNTAMVQNLVERNVIRSEEVERAFRNVKRAKFVPEDQRINSYRDTALRLKEGATISAPHMVAISTELLEVGKGSRVLEIGSGSGYQLAILAELTDGEVIGVEIDPELAHESRKRLSGYGNVTVKQGVGLEPVEGGFDRILYSCAIDGLSEPRQRLKDGGIIVAPVWEDDKQILKRLKNDLVEDHAKVRFVDYREES